MVAEHALLAAQAIADAEEASRKASSLLEAARKLEDLHHNTLKGRQGVLLASMTCHVLSCIVVGLLEPVLLVCEPLWEAVHFAIGPHDGSLSRLQKQ